MVPCCHRHCIISNGSHTFHLCVLNLFILSFKLIFYRHFRSKSHNFLLFIYFLLFYYYYYYYFKYLSFNVFYWIFYDL